jgi:hypothetical protein
MKILTQVFKVRLINYAPRQEDVLENGDIVPPFLTSALDGGEWSASHLGCFSPGTHCVGGWMGPRAGPDVAEKRKISWVFRISNPD